ncbi:long-chain fatty acid--CoA ligase [Brevibacillus sp. SYP-B805]|uniref:long-chain fatty acid--CoA ligase n=1 Tax=Brevibacillus sp. SYP-B805 TaxID=1578199 RepID=UPI0013EA62BE|nr:long-chain fatty acid--CoA ligase [Brevibacillus sp. SYP-B805]NGQ97485.1 long-chain fatty acid--CoA ligase [Brevibacillus sp. SYP-B805]
MNRHVAFWPKRLPTTLTVPKTTIDANLAVSANRYPDKAAIWYYGRVITYRELDDDVNNMAGFLQKKLNVAKGDRVLLYMQNSPPYIMAYYAILRAGAVVVPINPMNTTEELAFYLEDSEAKVAVVGQELYDRIAPLLERTPLEHVITAAYSEYANPSGEEPLPAFLLAASERMQDERVTPWSEALSAGCAPDAVAFSTDDMAVLPYTSGTTGIPKGCMHTHRTVQANILGSVAWGNLTADTVSLSALPFFHVTGMQHSMNAPIFSGSTIVLMTRWDRETAKWLIRQHGCTHWVNISTMLIDFLSTPGLTREDVQSLCYIAGGGAPLPEAVGKKLLELTGLMYVEGYGLTETISQTHFNPPDRPKLQCLGIPSFDVEAKVVHPVTLQELGPGEEGELIVHGPQVFKGYWKRPEETEQAFVRKEGKPFFRTGDIVKFDDEGYFFMVDRVKRMINAAGYKVWPTEVESVLYKHPAVEQACVIGVPDERRGEQVKAYIVLRESCRDKTGAQELIDWASTQMASYKYPRIVEFVDRLPISGSGKILWRVLQEQERSKRQNA